MSTDTLAAASSRVNECVVLSSFVSEIVEPAATVKQVGSKANPEAVSESVAVAVAAVQAPPPDEDPPPDGVLESLLLHAAPARASTATKAKKVLRMRLPSVKGKAPLGGGAPTIHTSLAGPWLAGLARSGVR